MAIKTLVAANARQKENFINKFADIIKNNAKLKDKYKIQFFDSTTKSNYVFNDLDGKSINVLQSLTLEETEEYKKLKHAWQE
jgi:hypothetical protein